MTKFLYIRLFLFSVLLLCPEFVSGQSEGNTKITFTDHKVSVNDFSHAIHAQAGFNISYNSQDLPPDFLLTFKSTEMTLGQALQYMKKMYKISYSIKGKTIILTQKKTSGSKGKSRSEKSDKSRKSKKNKQKNGDLTQPPSTQGKTESPERQEKDFVPSHPEKGDKNRNKRRSFLFQNRGSEINTYKYTNKQNGIFSYKKVNFSAGMQAEKAFYVNPFIEAGYGHFMLTLRYAYAPDIGHIRYGIKYDIDLGDKHSLGIEANYGIFEKPINFSYTEVKYEGDSTETREIVNVFDYQFQNYNQLYKTDISYHYHLARHIDIKLSVSFNYLNVRIENIMPGNTSEPSLMHPEILNRISFHDFSTVSTPYNLINTFSIHRNQYSRYWIGAGLGIRYRFLK